MDIENTLSGGYTVLAVRRSGCDREGVRARMNAGTQAGIRRRQRLRLAGRYWQLYLPVSYTHLTLPTILTV